MLCCVSSPHTLPGVLVTPCERFSRGSGGVGGGESTSPPGEDSITGGSKNDSCDADFVKPRPSSKKVSTHWKCYIVIIHADRERGKTPNTHRVPRTSDAENTY